MSNAEERARILRMVADGTVTPIEAEDLLAALEPPRSAATGGTAGSAGAPSGHPAPPTPPARPPAPRRNLVILISEDEGTKVNLRIPLSLARAAGKFIPRNAQVALEGYNIDLNELLESLDATDQGGTLLQVNDGDNKIMIAVE